MYGATEFSGEPIESDEMAPEWFSVHDIPYGTKTKESQLPNTAYNATLAVWSIVGKGKHKRSTVLVKHGPPREHVKEQNRTGKIATSAFFHVSRVHV